MKNTYKPKVGQTLYSLNIGNSARNCEQKLSKVTVTKVGSKYFECVHEGWTRGTKYYIENWWEVSEYSPNTSLYDSPQQWEDEKLSRQICSEISKGFEWGNNGRNLTLENLKKIKDILDEGENNAR